MYLVLAFESKPLFVIAVQERNAKVLVKSQVLSVI